MVLLGMFIFSFHSGKTKLSVFNVFEILSTELRHEASVTDKMPFDAKTVT